MTQAEQAYKVLQRLTTSDATLFEEFDTWTLSAWTLRCMEALTNKVEALELEVSKLKVKHETGKN